MRRRVRGFSTQPRRWIGCLKCSARVLQQMLRACVSARGRVADIHPHVYATREQTPRRDDIFLENVALGPLLEVRVY